MKILEQILQEIDKKIEEVEKIIVNPPADSLDKSANDTAEAFIGAYKGCQSIIRSHMEDDGWIPVEKRLPEPGEIVLVQQIYSWEHFEEGAMVTVGRLRPVEDGMMPYWELQHYRPDFKYGTIMDNGIICPGNEYVTHWQPLPAPYQPKEV